MKQTNFLTEMEMRSALASYVAMMGSKEPWFSKAFQRQSHDAVLFCLRLLFGFQEARAEDLYEGPWGNRP